VNNMRNRISMLIGVFVKVILFASSYIPLFIIMIFQLWEASTIKLGDDNKFSFLHMRTWDSLLKLTHFKEILFLVILIFALIVLLAYLIYFPTDSNTLKNIPIRNVENINANYITSYFSVYIFPFITLNFTSFNGMATVIVLVSLIGYVYIRNDLVYINPILHLLFRYNIYEVEVVENQVARKVTILSRMSRIKLKTSTDLKFNKISKDIWIEPKIIKKQK
jgi:hypothetical protein